MSTANTLAADKPALRAVPTGELSKMQPINPSAKGVMGLIGDGDHSRIWGAITPSGLGVAEITHPDLWRKCTNLVEGDRIFARAEDEAFDAHLLVRRVNADHSPALLQCVWSTRLDKVLAETRETPELYTVKHLGAVKRYTVVRAGDGEEVKSGFPSEQHAREYIQLTLISAGPRKGGQQAAG